MHGIIYRIINKISGKLYVGQTTNTLEARWEKHRNASKKSPYLLYRAIRKYGIENFYIEHLDIAQNQEELDDKEIYYGELYNALAPEGYSLKLGQGKGYTSEETRKRISIAKMGTPAWNKGIPASKETKRKKSEALKGKPVSAVMHQRALEANLGRKCSEETKIKIGLANKGKTNSPETRRKISEANKGRKASVIKSVICLNNGVVYESVTKAANTLKLQISKVSAVCRGKRKTTGGLKFKFFEDIQKEQSLSK